MSGEISCYIKLSDVKISDRFFEKIDHCFEKIGFELCKSSESFFGTMVWTPEPVEDWERIGWSDRVRILHKGNILNLEYSSDEKFWLLHTDIFSAKANWSVQIYYSGTMMTDCIGIETKHLGYLEEYAEKDKDLALRYQSVARDIHRIFGATETKAMVEVYDDEPWFHFSEDEWRTIGDLSLEKCGIPHLRIWAKNPERPITRDYYRNGNVFPNPERWQPAASVPITGDSEFREFHLNYTDKSGSRRIALLRNCLCCGGIFPCSRRDHLFCGPSEDEKQKFREIGWAAGNLDGVAEVLGKPDFHLEPVIYGKKKLNAEKGIRNMTVYANISDDVVVIFKEYNQGMIIANYAGKWRGGKVGDR